MIHLLLPDVGPMPPPVEWDELTPDDLVKAYEALPEAKSGNGRKCSIPDMMKALYEANDAEVGSWVDAVIANHVPAVHGDIEPLKGVVERRLNMGLNEFLEASSKYISTKLKALQEEGAALKAETDREIAEGVALRAERGQTVATLRRLDREIAAIGMLQEALESLDTTSRAPPANNH